MNPVLRGILLMLGAMLLLASMDTMAKYLTTVYPIAQILWLRFAVFLVAALLLARLWRGAAPDRAAPEPAAPDRAVGSPTGSPWRSRRPLLQVLRSLVLVAEMSVFMLGFRHLPLADVHAVAAASPLVAVALAALLLREEVPARRWLAVACGFAGVLLILRPGFADFGWLQAVPIVAAFLWGGYQVFLRYVARFDPPAVTTFYTAATGLAAACLVAPLLWVPPDAQGWLLLGILALLGAAAHVTLILALDSAPAALLQPYTYTLLLWVTLLGYLVFGDLPDLLTIVGAAVVVGSGLLVLRDDLRRDRRRRRT
ncbi:DMT family transporter [Marinibaculum pumilum]|uniref:DMT family transporter n=1 Tax=Marinibaculum pumilum TaxID=1766165 RepID=A0ABV7KYD9_9PROT